MKNSSLIAACIALSSSFASAQNVTQNIAYGPGDRQVLDLYKPNANETAPAILFIHGGRWMRGDKSQVTLYDRVDQMTRAGFVIAAMNHTYSTSAPWPAQKDDVRAALTFLHDNASDLGIDPTRIAIWGQSSGAHLALWGGLLNALNDGPKVQAVVAWYAPSNLYQLDPDRAADDVPGGTDTPTADAPESQLLGVDVAIHKDRADAASPERQIANLEPEIRLPPMFLAQGDADPIVSPLQTERLANTLADRNAAVTVAIVPGAAHGGKEFEAVTPKTIAFLKSYLMPGN